ncbi:MAG: hypothetical protein FJZ12_00565 [Candidatus Omnitrophica bacterium]|nr:hypothetical protein [Candidatus Omnitrophota bacterium]
MDKHMIKRIIAKEILIIAALAGISYIIFHFILQNVPVVLPKYRLEFANGENYTINIMPEIRAYSNYGKFLEEAYNPPPRLVEKRIKEFSRIMGIKAVLKERKYVNPAQVNLSRLYSRLVGASFPLKLIFIYLFLLFIRFVTWAFRILTKPSLQH